MKKTRISATILIAIITLIVTILYVNLINSEETQYNNFETHSFTKAICNSENFCQDYHIKCSESKILNINPITGAAVQFSENWQDPRDEQTRKIIC